MAEPEGGQSNEVNLTVFRDGTLHRANLLWSVVSVKAGEDLYPTSGSLFFEKGIQK